MRDQHPTWGPRKLKALLPPEPAYQQLSLSTLAAILRRHGRVDRQEAAKHKPWRRFQAAAPNDLWQMDFKGHFPLLQGGRCHPLTVLDDHSRFLLGLRACPNETGLTARAQLTQIFRCYGLPQVLLMDNGSPWGSDWEHPYTPLTVWLLRLGIVTSHSRAYHPQTLGKDERLHRTLNEELLANHPFLDLGDSQRHFDPWREVYNCQRPHEALAMSVPASRYRPSPRGFPEQLPPIEYGPEYVVRKVQAQGEVYLHGRRFKIGNAFRGYPVGLRPTTTNGLLDVFFCRQHVAQINLKADNDG
ncbi:MAG: Integrase core domain protein [Actinobacteria bacterium ADurb.Bin444]|nr:MAG: Integrase core domain protein [Actinobacteria bacterium ADurb.Bin444]